MAKLTFLNSPNEDFIRWSDLFSNRYVKVSYTTPTSTTHELGNMSVFDFVEYLHNSEVKNFVETETGCKFITSFRCYEVTFTELPSDQWGNTACYQDLFLQTGYYWLATNVDGDLYHDLPASLDLDVEHFLDWCLHSMPDNFSTIKEKIGSNSWMVVTTTNINPESDKFLSIVEQYQNEKEIQYV